MRQQHGMFEEVGRRAHTRTHVHSVMLSCAVCLHHIFGCPIHDLSFSPSPISPTLVSLNSGTDTTKQLSTVLPRGSFELIGNIAAGVTAPYMRKISLRDSVAGSLLPSSDPEHEIRTTWWWERETEFIRGGGRVCQSV